jgi:pimeloyl-ACP methyl ester carboxylesterase
MEKYVRYLEGDIHYEDTGKGDVVVLAHGYLESLDVWSGFSILLEKRFRVISVDLPGNGLSDLYKSEHTMCFLAGSVLAVLDQEKIEKCFLVGHSLGGYMALSFLENYPKRLYGYCLFHSHPFADTDEIKLNRLREMEIVRQGRKEIIYPVNVAKMFADMNLDKFRDAVEHSKEIASRHEAEGIISILNGMMNRKARDYIMEEMDVPALVILGRFDNYINRDMIAEKIKIPSTGRLITLEQSGHMGFIEEPEASFNEISKFIDEIIH